MKPKDNLPDVVSDDPYYDFFDASDDLYYDFFYGGHLEPEMFLEKEEDIERVRKARAVIVEFLDLIKDVVEEI